MIDCSKIKKALTSKLAEWLSVLKGNPRKESSVARKHDFMQKNVGIDDSDPRNN